MSTSAEIGRKPMAVSRVLSQSGLSPLSTPRRYRPANIGQASPVTTALQWTGRGGARTFELTTMFADLSKL